MIHKITHYKDSVIVMPKQKRVVIKRQFYRKTPSGKLKRLKRNWDFIKEWQLKNDIPKEEFTTTKSFFDSTAFNNDDREYSAEIISFRYAPKKIKEIEDYVVNKYEITHEFKEYISNCI